MSIALLGFAIALAGAAISVSITFAALTISRAIRGLPGWQDPSPEEEGEED